MTFNRIMIAAPKSGSGKTTVTCALLQCLKNMGYSVISYKCGPDYIDPMFHSKILDIPSKNLDTFFTDADQTRQLLVEGYHGEDLAILEGVMGIYDGLGGIREEGSSYHLAKITQTPIVLVVDAKGMGRSIIAMIAGFLQYDHAHLIQGIILNRMSRAYYEMIVPWIEKELKITVLGYVPEEKDCAIESRHLGLILPEEVEDLHKKLNRMAEKIKDSLAIPILVDMSRHAKAIDVASDVESIQKSEDGPVIAVAKDEAFCFYYEDNLRLLEKMGARLVAFSPLHDSKLPEPCHGILLGGGYPELYAKALSENHAMHQAIKTAFAQEIPVVAECGGFMYLHDYIETKEGQCFKMAGVLKGNCSYKNKLVRFGYIEIKDQQGYFLGKGQRIRGHEFHYFDSSDSGESCVAQKPVTGRSYPCIIENENYWLGFPHLYYPSNPVFAETFVNKCKKNRTHV